MVRQAVSVGTGRRRLHIMTCNISDVVNNSVVDEI